MASRDWGYVAHDPERPDRRMAECLVRDQVPWAAINELCTKTAETKERVEALLRAAGQELPVTVRGSWYP